MELHAQISCAMPRELARKGIGWQDRAVYTEAIYYGRENLTDGVIARSALAFWMPDMPVRERVRRLDALRDAGALLDHPEGWTFPDHVWRKWGKTRAQVEEKRAEEAERLRKYREQQKAAKDPAYAERTSVQGRTYDDRTECVRDAYETPEPQPQPQPEPQPYPYPYPDPPPSSSRSLTLVRGYTPDDDGTDPYRRAINIVVLSKEMDSPPDNPNGWWPVVQANTRTECGDMIRAHLDAGCTPVEAAGRVLNSKMRAEYAARHLERRLSA